MSLNSAANSDFNVNVLRLPIRVYEMTKIAEISTATLVTTPYKGL